jgi:acyl-CoA hydrolase
MSELTPVPVSQSKVIMTEMVLPQHINALGSIFGGVIMSWIDIAAAISSMRHCGIQTVTASIDAMNFVQPVYKGWVVNVRAAVNFVSHTSMEVGVRVDAENPLQKKVFHTASAYLTFVAVDANGKPVPVPQVLPQTPEEVRRHAAAALRRQQRVEQRKLFAK